MSKFLVTLPYNSAYLMTAKDFATFTDLINSSQSVTQEYYYDTKKNYCQVIVSNTELKLTVTLTNEQAITAKEFSVLKETIANSTEEV